VAADVPETGKDSIVFFSVKNVELINDYLDHVSF
jgi:hypothetical protein